MTISTSVQQTYIRVLPTHTDTLYRLVYTIEKGPVIKTASTKYKLGFDNLSA